MTSSYESAEKNMEMNVNVQSSCTGGGVSEEEARLRAIKGPMYLFWGGIIQMTLGTLSFIDGIIMIIYGWERGNPFSTGVGIWSGVNLFIVGILGFAASFQHFNRNNGTLKGLLIAYYVMAIGTNTTAGMNIGYNAAGVGLCATGGKGCSPNMDALMACAAAGMVLGILMFPTSILSTVFYWRYANFFGLGCRKR